MSEEKALYKPRLGTELERQQERIELIKRMFAKDATDDELQLFLYTAQRLGLDPLARQIHFVKRWDKRANKKIGVIQTGIDGYRAIADRTGKYAGNDDAVFRYEEGVDHPIAATVTVYKMIGNKRCPFTATARWDEYCPEGKAAFMWHSKPHVMLAKCAEALALRKAFPLQLSGVYVDAEMQQAGPVIETQVETVAASKTASQETSKNRPAMPTVVKQQLIEQARAYREKGKTGEPSPQARGLMAGKLAEAHPQADQARHLFLEYVFGKPSSKDLDRAEVGAVLNWLLDGQDPDTNDYILNDHAVQELAAIVREQLLVHGQTTFAEEV